MKDEQAAAIARNLGYARTFGLSAASKLYLASKVDGRWSWEYHEKSVYDLVRRAARAAFRAVPGLRG